MPVRLIDRTGLEEDERQRLRDALAPQTTLEKLLEWGRSRTPHLRVEEIITQDEFTHDVVVPYDRGLYFAFDVT